MAKTKIGFKDLSVIQKVERARQIVEAMSGNADFATPLPALASVATAATTLETAYNDALEARTTAKQKTQIQENGEQALDGLLSQLAAYVENASGGDETKILSAGFDVRSQPRSIAPVQVQALAATAGDSEGTIDLAWDPTPAAGGGAKSYAIELSTESGTGPWTFSRVVTRSAATINGLTSGQRAWFRVAAVNANGQGPWSDPATKIVP